MEEIKASRASEKDLSSIRKVLKSEFSKDYSKLMQWYDSHFPEFLTNERPVWVLKDKSKLVGFIITHLHQDDAKIKINCIFVDKRYRRRYHGTSLIKEAEKFGSDYDCSLSSAATFKDYAGAIDFFRKCGYDIVGTFVSEETKERSLVRLEKIL